MRTHFCKQYSDFLISLPAEHLGKRLQEGHKYLRMSKIHYMLVSQGRHSPDRKTIKKEWETYLKSICVTKTECDSTVFLLLFRFLSPCF